MSFSFSSFEALLLQNAAALPNVKFSENADFRRISDMILSKISLRVNSDTTDEELISDVLSQIESFLRKPEGQGIRTELEKAAALLSKEISLGFNTIHTNIYDTVTDLYKQIMDRQDDYLRRENAEYLINENAEPSLDFGVLKWDQLKQSAYAEVVISSACKLANIPKEELNSLHLSYMKNKIIRPGFTKIDLNESLIDEVITNLDKIVTTRNSDEIKEVYDMLTKTSGYNGYCAFIKARITDNKPADSCAKLADKVELVRLVLKGLEIVPLNISEDTRTSLFNNAKLIQESSYIAEYYLLLCKNVTFKNSLILDNGLLNGDELSKFLANGNALKDIAYYLRVYHENMPVPNSGVSTERIISSKDTVRGIVSKKNSELMLRMHTVKTSCITKAYYNVLMDFVKSTPEEDIPTTMNRNNFIFTCEGIIKRTMDILVTKNGSVEDALYTFIIDMKYKNTVVSTLYKYLHKAYAKVTAEDERTDDTNIIARADSYVISTILSEFLVNKFCKRM
jgi:hypothetical protein